VTGFGVEPETGEGAASADLMEHGADWIVFASGLAIEHFHARFDLRSLLARFPHTRLAITTVTIQWALDELGLPPAVVTMPNDVEGLVDAIIQAAPAAKTDTEQNEISIA
jgi:uroporphyrinogen-III synthase